MMRAAIVDSYGPPEVVQIADVRRSQPADREVLVRVHATAVTAGDARIRGARFPAGFGPLVRLAFGCHPAPPPQGATARTAHSSTVDDRDVHLTETAR
jgi:hypothetical protein